MNPSSRRGFTLVELLVVIAIIGTLVGLLLPAVNAARARARQADCLNKMKELGTAITSYTTTGKGDFPGWVQVQKLDTSVTDQYTGSNGTPIPDIAVSWAAKLLPQLDQAGLWDQMLTTDNFNFANPPRLEIFICPDDEGTNTELARLTYVGNTGYIDSDPNEVINYPSDVKANGIMHDLRFGRNGQTVRSGTADIKDGAGTTLLLSENIHKDEDTFGLNGFKNTWLGPILPPNGAGPNYEQTFGMVWQFDNSTPNLPSSQAPMNRDPSSPLSYGGFDTARPQFYARPASSHPEVFNVTFAGGNARSINQNIEYRVYQQLMTPNGAKADALDYTNADEQSKMKAFMNPPLAESDY